MSLTSAAVLPIKATLVALPLLISSTIHSLAVRVFPHPRPASTSQQNQSPSGCTCSLRAVHHHEFVIASASSSVSELMYASCFSLGRARNFSLGLLLIV